MRDWKIGKEFKFTNNIILLREYAFENKFEEKCNTEKWACTMAKRIIYKMMVGVSKVELLFFNTFFFSN